MKTVAVIAEYNPFHNGHLHQLQQIRRHYGKDTAILAIMSGNYVQRADVAIFDKLTRARAAIHGGVNLVLELPFPFSLASSEYFASAGVSLAASLGVVDALSFGSECADEQALSFVAEGLDAPAFRHAFTERRRTHPTDGHARLTADAFAEVYGSSYAHILEHSNDLLAIEYLRAVKRLAPSMQILPILRSGDAYTEDLLHTPSHPSATAIRRLIEKGAPFSETLPPEVDGILHGAIERGEAPCLSERLFPSVLASYLLNASQAPVTLGAAGGLYNRLRRFADEATSLSSWIAMSETKKYTRARIRRTLWASFLGVTSSDVKARPLYTQLLGADRVGLSLLQRMRKASDIPILTKPSDIHRLSTEAAAQKALSDRADKLFVLSRPTPEAPASALRYHPYLKK